MLCTQFKQPIHILGAGSIGLLFAASIRNVFPSYPLKVLLRKNHKSKLETITDGNGIQNFINVCISREASQRIYTKIPAEIINDSGSSKIKNLLLATKAIDASCAVNSIRNNLETGSRIIILCNGSLSVRDEIYKILSHQHSVTLVSTSHGAYRDTSNNVLGKKDDDDALLYHIKHAGVGTTIVEDDPSLANLFDQSGLYAKSSIDMELVLWKKLAVNCVINPLTALLSCKNGELYRFSLYKTMMPQIIKEVSLVSPFPEKLTTEILQASVSQVISETKENKSSMLQDVQLGRETEINYLNGYIIKRGIDLEIPTPANKEIYDRILCIEN